MAFDNTEIARDGLSLSDPIRSMIVHEVCVFSLQWPQHRRVIGPGGNTLNTCRLSSNIVTMQSLFRASSSFWGSGWQKVQIASPCLRKSSQIPFTSPAILQCLILGKIEESTYVSWPFPESAQHALVLPLQEASRPYTLWWCPGPIIWNTHLLAAKWRNSLYFLPRFRLGVLNMRGRDWQ